MSDGVSSADVAAIRARCEAATPGPWSAYGDDDLSGWYGGVDDGRGLLLVRVARQSDAAFIAAARTDVPALLDALAQAEERAAALERIVAAFAAVAEPRDGEFGYCLFCTARDDETPHDADCPVVLARAALGEAAPATREE